MIYSKHVNLLFMAALNEERMYFSSTSVVGIRLNEYFKRKYIIIVTLCYLRPYLKFFGICALRIILQLKTRRL